MELLNSIITYAGAAIVAGIVALILGRKQGRNIQVDIEGKYQNMLASEIEARRKLSKEINEMEKRFEQLEDENKSLRRAFARAIAHIRSINGGAEIPDFFADTGPLNVRKTK